MPRESGLLDSSLSVVGVQDLLQGEKPLVVVVGVVVVGVVFAGVVVAGVVAVGVVDGVVVGVVVVGLVVGSSLPATPLGRD